MHRYAEDPSTQVLCVGYCVDDEPVQIWHPRDLVPKVFHEAAGNSDWVAVAHNAAFELAIERAILGPHHGFPLLPVERNVCTMAAALAMALPGKLETCAKVLNLSQQKDLTGRRAMLQLTKPRNPRKGEDPNSVYWYDDAERLERLNRYCMQDVETERQLYQSLYLLSPDEQALWLLDQQINDRGFYIDYDLALAANRIVDEAYPILNAELQELTDKQVTSLNQVMQMRAWLLSECRIDAPDLDKTSVEILLAARLDPRARRLLEIRQLGAHAAVRKIPAFINRRGSDNRVRGEFQFHAAGTGRWSSRGVQVHNLKRLPDGFDYEAVIKSVHCCRYAQMARSFTDPLQAIGTLMRPLICAAPGHELWGADFSGIEARVTAWLADEQRKLDVFRDYDAGKGPDPYVVAAAIIYKCTPEQVTKEQRQVGKACELAFGFQGGIKAFRKFSSDDSFTDDEVEDIKQAWRDAHPKICSLWYGLNDAFWSAARTPMQLQTINRRIMVCFDTESLTLPLIWMTLPSGRQLAYPDARIRTPKFYEPNAGSGRGVYFNDNSMGRWRDVRVYGGLICENAVQAVARDLLAEALKRLNAAGFSIVTHTHDEVCVEEPKNSKRFKKFTRLMNVVPEWAAGLPIVAKPWRAERYVK